jgi:hypothetical protein
LVGPQAVAMLNQLLYEVKKLDDKQLLVEVHLLVSPPPPHPPTSLPKLSQFRCVYIHIFNVCVYIYIHIHIYIHTHTSIQLNLNLQYYSFMRVCVL